MEQEGSDVATEIGCDDHNADGDQISKHPQTEADSAAEDSNTNLLKDGKKLPPPAICLLGARSAVDKMRLLLEFQADNWNELDELEDAWRSLYGQL
ncbi:unnamed protein product [Echinostoma caproni]|uniref:Uncharacterized protein n=1 Tax=Echinostoma caproni TaxID=27848 RepID=A0A183B336_9TREM|nr:unnamed protein product [Echinostoma caproni]